MCDDVKSGKMKDLNRDNEGILKFGNRLYVPNSGDLRRELMEEAHCLAYAMHLGSTKMYRTIKGNYWWKGMKGDIA